MSITKLKLRASSENDVYTIRFKNFEGPFDLLFHLIEKNKLNIYEIPIGEITDRYMAHIMKMQKLNLDIASEFIVMASTLLYIKSKSLLPTKQNDEDEDMDISSKDELILRLIEYKKYKNMANKFRKMQDYWEKAYYKKPEKMDMLKSKEIVEMSLDKMLDIYQALLERNIKKQNDNERKMVRILRLEKITIRQKIKDIVKKLIELSSFKFGEIFKKKPKLEIVTGFMAMLELVKSHKVIVNQEKLFSEIIVSKNSSNEDLESYATREENDGV